MSNAPGAGPHTLLAQLVADIVTTSQNAWRNGQARSAVRAAEHEARLAEARARERRRAWLAAVQRQAAQRVAGDASEAETRAVLGGHGGRRNPLDDRKFR